MQEQFGQYNLMKKLAQKHSHLTYLASPINPQRNHGEPDRQVVLTVFASSLFSLPRERENLLQKVRRLKELQHPHLAPILDIGIEENQPFVVREYLPKESLRHRLKQLSPGRLELQDALTLVLQVGEALVSAHEHNILHGNIKPENVLFDASDQPILVDFSLVSRKDAIIRDQTTEEYAFCYMAPEQFTGGTCDTRSDQYALGCLTYELITGRVPFVAQGLTSMIEQPGMARLVPLSESAPNIPSFLEIAVHRTLSYKAAERFFDLSLFLGAIKSVLSPPPAFPLANAVSSREKSNVACAPPQPAERSGTSSRVEIDREEYVDTPLTSQASLPEWTGIIPASESLELVLQANQLTSSFSQDADTLDSEENQETIASFEQQDAGALSTIASTRSFQGYSEDTFAEEIFLVRENLEIVGPQTGMFLHMRRRALELALLLSVIVCVICSALWLSGIGNLHTTEKEIQAVAPPITNTSPVQSSLQATGVVTPLPSPQATSIPTAQPTGNVVTTPNAQSISSASSATVKPTSYEAESSQNTLGGDARTYTCSGCSGGKKVGNIGDSGTLQFNRVKVSNTSNYTLTIYYVDGDAGRTMYVNTNGGSGIAIKVSGTGNWNTVGTVSITVSLNTGNNTIEFYNTSARGPDIDRIVV